MFSSCRNISEHWWHLRERTTTNALQELRAGGDTSVAPNWETQCVMCDIVQTRTAAGHLL